MFPLADPLLSAVVPLARLILHAQSLCHDWLVDFYKREGILSFESSDLNYGKRYLGSDRLLSRLSAFYASYLRPRSPVEPEHLITMNGVTSALSHLAASISDVGDSWLATKPMYYSFVRDLGAFSKVGLVSVDVADGQHGEMGEVEACEAELQRRERAGGSKISAILLCNPHNPLGASFPPLSPGRID